MRVISRESASLVYHRETCYHVLRMKKENRRTISLRNAEERGYRPCKCCNNIRFAYEMELSHITDIASRYGMEVNLKNNAVYVRTDIGSWRIQYRKHAQRFILFHSVNRGPRPSLGEVELLHYHRQGDIWEAGTICKCLSYIGAHDEFKKKMPSDYRKMPQDTRRQKKYYQAAKRREEKRSARRLDQLFCMVEEKEGIKMYSIC